jgi:imidazole glycerol phosphate synthase glutamine amidotransferase subunit
MKVTLIDYAAGNMPSVERALERLGAPCERTSTPEGLARADVLLLPGVGHYAALIRALDERELRGPLVDAITRGVPFLGICLGLQALFDASEEAPELAGLRLFSGSVRSLPGTVKLPHMGWNQLRRKRESRLLAGIPSEAYFYFAHSYAAMDAQDQDNVTGTCTHGAEFVAVLEKRNILGVQFHPEKSGAAGAQVLCNFLRLAA